MSDRIEPSEFVVKSKVKQLFAEADVRASADVYNEVGHAVTRAVKQAIRRAQANGRKTVKGSDF
jgi:histone H3/H4